MYFSDAMPQPIRRAPPIEDENLYGQMRFVVLAKNTQLYEEIKYQINQMRGIAGVVDFPSCDQPRPGHLVGP